MTIESNHEEKIPKEKKRELNKLRETISNLDPEIRNKLVHNSAIQAYLNTINTMFSDMVPNLYTKIIDIHRNDFEKLNINSMNIDKAIQDMREAIAGVDFPIKNMNLSEIKLPTNLVNHFEGIMANSIPENFGKEFSSHVAKLIEDTKELRPIEIYSIPNSINTMEATAFVAGEHLDDIMNGSEEIADFNITIEHEDGTSTSPQSKSYKITDKYGNILSRENSVDLLRSVISNLSQE